MEIGKFRYCPACGRPVDPTPLAGANPETAREQNRLDEVVCSCCQRPWIACPCTPATEGYCRVAGHRP